MDRVLNDVNAAVMLHNVGLMKSVLRVSCMIHGMTAAWPRDRPICVHVLNINCIVVPQRHMALDLLHDAQALGFAAALSSLLWRTVHLKKYVPNVLPSSSNLLVLNEAACRAARILAFKLHMLHNLVSIQSIPWKEGVLCDA
jgi:hypothetical protein